ncbi:MULTISPECIES: hypothetical protein [unclassified Mesorhizobium]|nr:MULTISPECIES: hypothetical protein [unclassified Mesorhizobium]
MLARPDASPRCSLAHHRKRAAEGTLPQEPAPDPFEVPSLFPR